MTDSSSDGEDRLKLLQAVDKDFMNDRLYKEGSVECEKIGLTTNVLPSLRYTEADAIDQSNINGLNVTPEFQKYVAKHLTNLLDQQLKEVNRSRNRVKRKQNEEDPGVRLLYSSPKNICFQDPVDTSGAHNAKWKPQAQDVDSEEENLKISESAVSSDWILTGEAVKGWVKSTKGEVVPGVSVESGSMPSVNPTGKKKKKKKKAKTGSVVAEALK